MGHDEDQNMGRDEEQHTGRVEYHEHHKDLLRSACLVCVHRWETLHIHRSNLGQSLKSKAHT